MRLFSTTFLALLLVLSNIVLAADIHAEALTGQHHSDMELHAGEPCSPDETGENHLQCHHCCHAQGHFSSLLQRIYPGWKMPGHDWTLTEAAYPHPQAYAPPVPPPKA